jgi:hypothetical protein
MAHDQYHVLKNGLFHDEEEVVSKGFLVGLAGEPRRPCGEPWNSVSSIKMSRVAASWLTVCSITKGLLR